MSKIVVLLWLHQYLVLLLMFIVHLKFLIWSCRLCYYGYSIFHILFYKNHWLLYVVTNCVDSVIKSLMDSCIYTGPVILESTSGPFDLTENNTFTIYCVIQNQIDALEPLTIQWFRNGEVFNDTDTITITTTEENNANNRIVNSTVFFNPLVPSDNYPDYKCQAYIGNRLSDAIESDFISLNVRCECVCLFSYIFVFIYVCLCVCPSV